MRRAEHAVASEELRPEVLSSLSSRPRTTVGFWVFVVSSLLLFALWIWPDPRATNEVQGAAILCILLVLPVAGTFAWISHGQGPTFWFGPTGIPLIYLWLSLLAVPILWWFGLATPWDDYFAPTDTLVLLVGTSLFAFAAGTAASGRTKEFLRVRLDVRSASTLTGGMGILIVAGLAGIAYLLLATGGLGVLLGSLGSRREALAGLGLASVLAAPAGVAAFVPLMQARPRLASKLIGSTGAISYIVFLFVSGSRFPMIAYMVALVIARHQHRPVHPRTLLAIIGFSAPFSVWYTYSVRQQGRGQGQLGGDDLTSTVKSVVDPFVFGGVDLLRTSGKIIGPDMTVIDSRPMQLLSGLFTLVPRGLWPGKPDGIAIRFSQEYFPDRWADGTGVPPSLPAEATYLWGYAGGLVYVFVLGWLLTRVGRAMWSSNSLFQRLLLPMLATDTIVLVKSGSDSFFRLLFIHVIAVAICAFILKRSGVTVDAETIER